VLVAKSRKRFKDELPGPFTPSHRRLGRFGFGGTVFGALSAIVMYGLGFIA